MLLASSVHLPGILAHLAPVITHYGYLAVAGLIFIEDFGIPVPGETTLLAAAVYAGAGQLNPILVGLVALAAAVLGDNVGYLIGRLVSRDAILAVGRYGGLNEERLDRAERYFNKHGGKIIAIARFIEGLRQANGIIAGLSKMAWLRFLTFNVIGAVLWVGCWLTVGIVAGNHITTVYNDITKYSYVVLALIFVVFVALGIAKRRKRHRSRSGGRASTT